MHVYALVSLCRVERPDAAIARIRACGGLDAAIAAAANDPGQRDLDELLSLRSALEQRDDPALRARRLRAEASRLDDRAERLRAEAADLFGRAAFRRAQGETSLAEDFSRRAEAAEGQACGLSDQAFALRLQACEAERLLSEARALAGVAS